MPRGPRGEKRPADVVGAAIKVARISVGDEEENLPSEGKARGGRKGAAARAKVLTSAQRSEIAKAAAEARWKKS